MAAAVRTLDIADPQVIVEYPLDAGGFYWHHRVLLHRIAPGVWISLTPDLELKRYDLNVQEHMLVGGPSDGLPAEPGALRLRARRHLCSSASTLASAGESHGGRPRGR